MKATCDTSLSAIDYSTGAPRLQGFIEKMLPQGAHNAVTTTELKRMTGITHTRDLQDRIALERKHGALILSKCGGDGGYYLPQNGPAGVGEIRDYVGTLTARAVNTLAILRPARAALEVMDGQTRMDLVVD